MEYLFVLCIGVGAGIWLAEKMPKNNVKPTTTALTITGDLPIPKLEDLTDHVMSYAGSTYVIQVADALYHLMAFTGANGDALTAYTINAGLAFKVSKIKKNGDFMLVKEGENIVVAKL